MTIAEIIGSSKELTQLMKQMPIHVRERLFYKKYEPNSVLFYKGDNLDYIYLLFRGEVQIANMFNNGSVFVIDRKNGISFIGEQTVLADENHASVTATALSESEFIVIRRTDFLHWLKVDHSFALYLLHCLAARNYRNSLDSGAKGYYSKRLLLERYLCTQFERQKNSRIVISIKRQELADTIGMSLRSLERSLSELKGESLLSVERRSIIINQHQYNILQEKISQ